MEHTITANGIQQGRPEGLVLSRLHIGLAAGCALVACLTAFGGGVIVGMWYKASEHMTPLNITVTTPAATQASAESETTGQTPTAEPVTFYDTLTGNPAAYAPLTPQPASPAQPETASPLVRTVSGSPGNQDSRSLQAGPSADVAVVPPQASPVKSSRTTSPASSQATATPSVSGTQAASVARAARAVAAQEANSAARATPPPQPAPTAAAVATATPKVAKYTRGAAQPSTRERQPVAAGRAASRADYSVQVGSFVSPRQAERLRTNLAQKGYPVRVQLSEIPGQGMRYRVRVGNYADRASADQSARHLTAQEQVPAIVAGKN